MSTAESTEPVKSTRRPLRVWPGLVAVFLLLFCRFALKGLLPGFGGYLRALEGALASAAVILLWWLFFSRAPWVDRIGAIVAMPVALALAWQLRHVSMGPGWLIAYAAPFVLLAFVLAAFAGRHLPHLQRRLIMGAAILVSALGWTLIRTEGIDGDHRATFAWRWSATSEQQLMARPIPAPPAPPVEPVPAQPAAPAAVSKPAAAAPVAIAAEWPGFRGPHRDSVVRGVSIATDWAKSPPVEVWRKPVGPAWSSFAVQGSLIYTQEQRGEEELVTAYKAATGDLIWRHADPVRFFESNAGAGPRATPTLAGGRVYTLGATGVLNALDAATGRRIWSRNTTEDTKQRVPDWGFSASPIVTHGLVIIYAGRLAAYHAENGQLKWLGKSTGGSYSSPHLATLGGVEQVLIHTPEGVSGIDPATGAPLWSHEWKGSPIIQPTLIPGGILVSASQTGGTRRIDPAHGPTGWTVDTRWTSRELKPYFNDTVVHNGHAYGFDARILACIDLNDGKRAWKGGRYGNGQVLLLADQNLLLVLGEEGDLALVRATPEGFTEVAKAPALQGKTWNHPAIAAGLLFVRNDREMAAFRLAASAK